MATVYVVLFESFTSTEVKRVFPTETDARSYITRQVKLDPGTRDCWWFEDHEVDL